MIFAEHLHGKLLEEVPHRHSVFSIPKRLRCFFRYDRSLHSILFSAAWQSIKELCQAAIPDGCPGAIFTIQTAGEALNHNPHLHGITADGVFLPDGSFQPLPKLKTEKLAGLFCHNVLRQLKARELITDTVINQIMSQNHTGFSAWLGEPVEATDAAARQFICRYIDRGPLANSRIEIVDDIITYHTENVPTAEFEALEFLAALSVHIPKKWEQTTRYFGWYAARTRGARKNKLTLEACCEVLPLPDDEQQRAISKTWAALIKKVYEVDPLVCPKCGEQMKIIAFIKDIKEIAKIMDNLGLPHFRAPPKIEPQSPSEPYYDDLEFAA